MARRRTSYLTVLIVASVLVACAASKEAVPTFAGKNGKIAFASTRDGKTGGLTTSSMRWVCEQSYWLL